MGYSVADDWMVVVMYVHACTYELALPKCVIQACFYRLSDGEAVWTIGLTENELVSVLSRHGIK